MQLRKLKGGVVVLLMAISYPIVAQQYVSPETLPPPAPPQSVYQQTYPQTAPPVATPHAPNYGVAVPMPQQPQVSYAQPVPPVPATGGFVQPNQGPSASEEQQTWMTNCLGAVNHQEAQSHAQAFCECGWQSVKVRMPQQLLTDPTPQGAQQRSAILKAVSQQCYVEIMAKEKVG